MVSRYDRYWIARVGRIQANLQPEPPLRPPIRESLRRHELELLHSQSGSPGVKDGEAGIAASFKLAVERQKEK